MDTLLKPGTFSRWVVCSLYLLIIGIPLVYSKGLLGNYQIPKLLLFWGLFSPAASFTVVLFFLRSRLYTEGDPFKLLKSPMSILLLLQIGSVILSTILSVNPHVSWYGSGARGIGTLTMISLIALYWVITGSAYRMEQAVGIIKVFVVTGTVVSLYGILQKFMPAQVGFVASFGDRIYSTMGNPEFLANLLLYPLFMNAGLFLYTKRNAGKIAYASMFMITLLAIILTYTRGAWLGVVAGMVVFSILYIRGAVERSGRRLLWIRIAAVTLVLVITVVASLWALGLKDGLIERASDPFSGKVRLLLWRDTLSLVKQSPVVGSGHEAFRVAFTPLKSAQLARLEQGLNYDNPHNNYLAFLANYGIIGLAVYAAIILLAAGYILKMVAERPSPGYTALATALGASFAAVMAHNLTNFDILPTYVYFYLFLGLVEIMRRVQDGSTLPDDDVEAAGMPWRRLFADLSGLALIFLLIAYISFNGVSVYRTYMCSRYIKLAENETAMLRYENALQYGKQAMEYLPSYGRGWYSLSQYSYNLAGLRAGGERDELLRSAVKYAGRAQVNYDNSESLLNLTAVCYHRLGDYDKAMEYYVQSVSQDPNYAVNLANLAAMLMQRGEYGQALTLLERAVYVSPGYIRAHVLRGTAGLNAGNMALAEEEAGFLSKNAPHDNGARIFFKDLKRISSVR
ncbi:MAG: O-antigen ligase family protein [bacterium]|nr:O-antigen ligase family protein [bacterium]